MNNWKVICERGWLPSIANCYGPAFPIEMRGFLASWLDVNPSYQHFDAENPDHHDIIRRFLLTMILHLKPEVEAMPQNDILSFSHKKLLNELASHILVLFANDYISLFKQIQESLLKENLEFQRLLNMASTHSTNPTNNNSNSRKPFDQLDEVITSDLREWKLQCTYIATNVREIGSKTLDLHNLQRQGPIHNHLYDPRGQVEVERRRFEINKLQTEILNLRAPTLQLFANVWNTIQHSYTKVVKELEDFEDEQRFVAIGKEPERNLSTIEGWLGLVYECVWSFEHSSIDFQAHLNLAGSQLSSEAANWLQEAPEKVLQATNWRNSLISKSLVIAQQSKQILRTKTKFSVTARVLIPNALIHQEETQAMLINKGQMIRLSKDPNCQPIASASIMTKKSYPRIERNEIEFCDLWIGKLSRFDKKVNKNEVRKKKERVMEEKFSIYFKLCVTIPGCGKKYLSTTSLPVVVTTHTNQECEAWATILWDNAFSARDRQPFQVPDEVPWTKFIHAINWRFLSLTKDVRQGLSEENMNYFKQSIFGDVNPVQELVTWSQFCKDEIFKKAANPKTIKEDDESANSKPAIVTFWSWIYSCHKLLSSSPDDPTIADQSLRKLWGEGKIFGFISHERMEALLKSANQIHAGTFILRFSESRLGSIGMCYYNCSAKTPKRALVKLEPYTINDLKQQPLHNKILDNKLVAYLYPDIPKGKAFTMTSLRDINTIGGYVQLDVKEVFPRDLLEKLKQGYAEKNLLNVERSPPPSISPTPHCSSSSAASASHPRNSSSGAEDNSGMSSRPMASSVMIEDDQSDINDPHNEIPEWLQDDNIFEP